MNEVNEQFAAIENAFKAVADKYGIYQTHTYKGIERKDRWEHHAWLIQIHCGEKSMQCPFMMGMHYSNAPEMIEVLKSVIGDGAARDMSFEEFCSDFGYSTDSISALATYNLCRENADNLQAVIGKAAMDEIAVIVADY